MRALWGLSADGLPAHELNILLEAFGLKTSENLSGSQQRKRFLHYIGAVQLAKEA